MIATELCDENSESKKKELDLAKQCHGKRRGLKIFNQIKKHAKILLFSTSIMIKFIDEGISVSVGSYCSNLTTSNVTFPTILQLIILLETMKIV